MKKSLNSFINELLNQKVSSALNTENVKDKKEETEKNIELEKPTSKIITTEEEIQSFFVIRGILAETVDINYITYKDTESYFGILYKNNSRKPICRLNLDSKRKQLFIPDENKTFERIYIESLNDLYNYKDKLIEVLKRYQ